MDERKAWRAAATALAVAETELQLRATAPFEIGEGKIFIFSHDYRKVTVSVFGGDARITTSIEAMNKKFRFLLNGDAGYVIARDRDDALVALARYYQTGRIEVDHVSEYTTDAQSVMLF